MAAIKDYPDVCNYTNTYNKMVSLALGCGLPVIHDTETLPQSLSQSLLKQGIMSLTLGLGESYVINERNIDTGVKTLCNLLVRNTMMAPIE